MIKIVLWDLDGTLLDFSLAERNSIKKAFKHFELGECSDENVMLYSKINDKYWKKLETGEISRSETLLGRFDEFFNTLNISSVDTAEFCNYYEKGLCDTAEFIGNSYDTVRKLKEKNIKQYAVTNGSYAIQRVKLKKSGLDNILDGAFISEEAGYEKPDRRFFDFVFDRIPKCNKKEILLVGDSLTSDIKGANTAGIKCCYYNPGGIKNKAGLKIDYEVDSSDKVIKIIEKENRQKIKLPGK